MGSDVVLGLFEVPMHVEAIEDHEIGKPPGSHWPSKWEKHHAKYSEIVEALVFPPGCELLGRVIARFPPKYHRIWEEEWEEGG
jgi:hypothetical protein